ncbi:FAD-dependent monooxygenase [Pseudonocardia kunmingensis]|uniref:2-polyprenyl-6-methoxyphenol hydroxylase-like FAD-dependent oxidoreductase n=1 Tax=Pseudonocardia kunmingensis TaxID=630975 RepID=A0A543D993_9PSEU|nr:FAD-dependent monooxygenase [Pseudonocardia kunmingensis]TQM05892.1 2-polyprenyl-6-methoxyphenol hydroxylase-like FAD-dependent oxidoreductase [Pseudonocardia kunmingensis]
MGVGDGVLVVGAGPTGLVLAAELARRGVLPRVVDAGPADVAESRAVAVAARSLELLDDLGLAAAAVAEGVPLRALNFYRGTRLVAELDTTAVDSPFPMDLCLAQWQTTQLLRDRVAELGVQIEWNTRVAAHDASASGVSVDLVHADGDTERCRVDWLVGCDGSRSTVRDTAGIGWRTADLHRGFILGDVTAPWDLARDRFHVWFARGGLVAAFPMPGGYWRILASTPDDRPPRPPGLPHFAAAVAERTPADPRLSDLRWSSAFVAREGLAERFRAGRVLLAGDAAHSHSPIGGQGMNTGMQDAYNLGWKLALVATGRAGASLLDSYGAERRPVAQTVVRATSTATRVATGNGLVARRARQYALGMLSRLNTVQQGFANAIGEHLVNYRGSDLVAQQWSSPRRRPWSAGDGTGPEAGEVVRDAYLESRSGPVALRHLLRDPGHHLVLFAADEADARTLTAWKAAAEEVMAGHGQVLLVTRGHLPTAPVEAVFADVRSEAHNRYGVRRPSLYLIRPDKYVAHRVDDVDLAAVRRYFQVLAGAPAPRPAGRAGALDPRHREGGDRLDQTVADAGSLPPASRIVR